MNQNIYLKATSLLDYQHPLIKTTISKFNWHHLNTRDQIKFIYNFVRNDILFGFNIDEIPASEVLKEGIGQCNTKSILFMALLRAVGIPCRLHGFTIDKQLQAGIMNEEVLDMMPDEISHTWVEVYFEQQWFDMEGIILDEQYLRGLQIQFANTQKQFTGYAVATSDLHNPQIDWHGNNSTYIQKEGIMQDFGIYADPDSFFAKHPQNISAEKRSVFANLLRHNVNQQINMIRRLAVSSK